MTIANEARFGIVRREESPVWGGMDESSVRPEVIWDGGEPALVWNLQGEINVGDRLVWEPLKEHARLECVVTRVVEVPNDERRIWMNSSLGEHWNEEGRLREACVRRVPES